MSEATPTVLITAGPTREYLDPVRFLSNPSTGRMGYALARAAGARGAEVILVSGPVKLRPPQGVKLVKVVSSAEMYREVMRHYTKADIVIMAAAVADYRPAGRARGKIKKDADEKVLRLVRTRDILTSLGRRKEGRVLVGFAAETGRIESNAKRKLRKKNLDCIVANDVSRPESGFESHTNEVVVLYRDGRREQFPLMSKEQLARRLVTRCFALHTGRGNYSATP